MNKKVLVLVKTYPTPSQTMNETVCTAGLTEDGEWIRIYPVPFRYLSGDQQFRVFDWVQCDLEKRPVGKDSRPESHHVDFDSIRIVGYLDSHRDVLDRYDLVHSTERPSLEALQEEHRNTRASLGLFRPGRMYGLSFEPDTPNWSPEERIKLSQMSLFVDPAKMVPLRKVPYKIYVVFESADTGKSHKLRMTGWEYNFTFLKLLDQYPCEPEKAQLELNSRWMKNFSEDRLGYLIAGTPLAQDRFGTFIIIGHCSFDQSVAYSGKQLSFI